MDTFKKDKVKRIIIEPMMARWRKPDHGDRDTILGDYIADLANFSEDALRFAFDTVRRAHKYQTWPKPIEFVEVAREHRTEGKREEKSVESDKDRIRLAITRDAHNHAIQATHRVTAGMEYLARKYAFQEFCRLANRGEELHVRFTDGWESRIEWDA